MNDNDEIEFTIKCKMKRSWMNTFCSFLKIMEKFGKCGMSRDIIFYCDGDGDFRPRFELPEYKTKQGKQYSIKFNGNKHDSYFFDVENKYVEEGESDILSITENIFAKQWFETEEEYQKRYNNICNDLYSIKTQEEFDKRKKMYLEEMKKLLKERKDFLNDMKELSSKNKRK